MFKTKNQNQLRVIESEEYQVVRAEIEEPQQLPQQRNGFVEMGKMSFAASFGASLGWWLGEFVAGAVKLAVIAVSVLVLLSVAGLIFWATH